MTSRRWKELVRGALWGCAALVIGGGLTAYLISAFDDEPAGGVRQTTIRSEEREPVTAPPTTRPTSSNLLIDGKPAKFPPARLVMLSDQPTVDLLLFSDEPKEALRPNYGGNRYYLPITLTIDDAGKIVSADFYARAPSMERADSPDGIFLDGDRIVLQPYEWRVGFSENGTGLNLVIDGQFLAFGHRDEAGPPRVVAVTGILQTELETRDKPRSADPASRR